MVESILRYSAALIIVFKYWAEIMSITTQLPIKIYN